MKLNKKGFTLIELLAVIVVLAIILVIAVPRILDVINKAAQGSLDQSAKMVAKYMQKDFALKSLEPTGAPTPATDVVCPDDAGHDKTQMDCKYTLTVTAGGQPTYVVTMTGKTGTRLAGKSATVTE